MSKRGNGETLDFEAVERSIIRNNELDAIFHGERFLRILGDRLHGGGLYFLDEPEAPLSPLNQVALAQMLLDAARAGGQFIVATHSPILLGVPGATIYEFTAEGVKQTLYEDLQSIRFLKRFIAAPEQQAAQSGRVCLGFLLHYSTASSASAIADCSAAIAPALFTLEERIDMVREAVKNYPQVQVEPFSGLLRDFVVARGGKAMVR
eukprot:gene65716-89902_t